MAFDVHETLRILREELQRVTEAIAALEKLNASSDRLHGDRRDKSMEATGN